MTWPPPSATLGLSLEQQKKVRQLASVLDCPALIHLSQLHSSQAEVEVREVNEGRE